MGRYGTKQASEGVGGWGVVVVVVVTVAIF